MASTKTRPDRAERRAIKGMAKRDPRSLEAIYDRYGRVTFAYLLRTLGDRGTAEDVQQQVFTEVWRRAETYDPDRAGLLTWIMQIARSRAIDQLRRRVPVPADPERVDRDAQVAAASAVDALDDRWRVAQLLQRLPSEEAAMLRMRFYDGLSQSEIAVASGAPLGTVKMRMVQGLGRMRELIDEEGL